MKPAFSDRILELLKDQDEIFNVLIADFPIKYEDKTKYFDYYNFRLFIYNRLYESKTFELEHIDIEILTWLNKCLKDEHIINWTRKKLYEIPDELVAEYKIFLPKITTNSAKAFKIILYLIRMADKNFYILDDYILNNVPYLGTFLKITNTNS